MKEGGKTSTKKVKAAVIDNAAAATAPYGECTDWRRELDEISVFMSSLNRNDASPVDLIVGLPEALGLLPGGNEDLGAELRKMTFRACKAAEAMAIVVGGAAAGDNDDEPIPSPSDRMRMRKALETIHYLEQAVSATSAAWKIASAAEGQPATIEDLVAGIARFSTVDHGEANRVQKLILYLLNAAQSKGYRRRHGDMYKRVDAPGKYACYDTHAWERVCDMQEFVYENCRKETNFEMWSCLTWAKMNLLSAVDYLHHCRDVQLPDLVKDRHVFSFKDGIYLAADDRFCPYGSSEHAAIPTHVVAAKYFPTSFRHAWKSGMPGMPEGEDDEDTAWYDRIKTPHVQSILDFQGMSEDVCRWVYAMIGRVLYEINEKDTWQVVLYLKGAASSGKSTLINHVCGKFYESSDIGVLSNNIEKKFGLSPFVDKLLIIGPEIKSDLQLEQAEFQQIVSGESVQVATKFKDAHAVKWVVPAALAGNEVPGWGDNAGSINRRMILVDFPKRVHDGDMELHLKIEREMPSILLKCNRAYLTAVRLHSKRNLWKVLPAALHETKEEHTESANSMVGFLRSGNLAYGKDLYMPYENFVSAYESYVQAMGLARIRLTGDKVTHPLIEAQCRIEKTATKRYPRNGSSVRTCKFVVGCDYTPESIARVCDIQSDPLD